jgi:hypothetical protein
MAGRKIYDTLYWTLRQENDEFIKRQRWWWRHLLAGTLKSIRQRQLFALATEAEQAVAAMIRARGYRVYLTTHKCPFDLWVVDGAGRAARVEVKISLYRRCHDPRKGGRFQANIRQHLDADLVVFVARNGQDWPFVIPMPEIRGRGNIAIWSRCPADSGGWLKGYLNAWEHLDHAVANTQRRVWQIRLPIGGPR